MGRVIFIIFVGGFLLAIIGLILRGTILKPAKAGLQVKSLPVSTVFLNGKNLGRTPFEEKNLSPGEVTLKLVPETLTGAFSPWETKLKLVGGTQTIVNREFGETEGGSAGEIMTLEKISGKTASLAIVSYPDSSLVQIDGESKGFTPFLQEKQAEGEREIIISAPGFVPRTVRIKLIPGFKLILNVKLAEEKQLAPEITPTSTLTPSPKPGVKITPTPVSLKRPYVVIKETPTGWLRVRMEPSTSATEAAKVKPGESFPLLEEKSGWYKITYTVGKEGWISGQYAEKFE